MCQNKKYFNTFELKEGGFVWLCIKAYKVLGVKTIRLKMFYNCEFLLYIVGCVPNSSELCYFWSCLIT